MWQLISGLDNTRSIKGASSYALFDLGFRPFFLCAGIYGILAIALWVANYALGFVFPESAVLSYQWHAHEMIFGYSLAVIAGFVLTAVKNWTGIQTIHGAPLLFLCLLWASARGLLYFGQVGLAAVVDMLFSFGLLMAVAVPIIKAKNWIQLAIVLNILMLMIANCLFYLGALGVMSNGINLGLYWGFYIVIGLILMMGRRVVPFFIERGVNSTVTLRNSKTIDISIMVAYILFVILTLSGYQPVATAYIALFIFVLNAWRLVGWHTLGIWSKSLLWSIYLVLWFVNIGFVLLYGSYLFGYSQSIAIHAFAYGGIATITIGMMSRISLGHTGRKVNDPAKLLSISFGVILLGAFVRVFLPLVFSDLYVLWIVISAVLWVIAFCLFLFIYFPILSKESVDV